MRRLLKSNLKHPEFGGNGTTGEESASCSTKKEKMALPPAPNEEKPRFHLSLGWISSLSLIFLALLWSRKELATETSPPRPLPLFPPPLPPSSLEELQGVVDGHLLLPGQPQYEKRRQVWLTSCKSHKTIAMFGMASLIMMGR